MLADIAERRDHGPVGRNGLERGHQLIIIDKRIRGPALAKVRGLDRFGVLETRPDANGCTLFFDRSSRTRDEEVDIVGIDSGGELIETRNAERVRR